jgi:Tfp pilus assembly PilM family ATPase
MFFRRNKKRKLDTALGIDIGASQIKAVIVRNQGDKLELVEYAAQPIATTPAKAYRGPEFAADLQKLVDSLKTAERHAFVTISCSSAMVSQAEFPTVTLDEIKSVLNLNSSG